MADKATTTLADLIGELKTRDAAVASNEGKVASALGDLLADGVAAKVAMGETITAIMANLGGDKAPVSQRAALAAVAAKPYSFVCSQTRWTQSVRAFTQVGTLTAKQMTADLKLYRTYAVSVNENPTVLGYLNWEKGDKAPPTLTELRDKRDEALDKATALRQSCSGRCRPARARRRAAPTATGLPPHAWPPPRPSPGCGWSPGSAAVPDCAGASASAGPSCRRRSPAPSCRRSGRTPGGRNRPRRSTPRRAPRRCRSRCGRAWPACGRAGTARSAAARRAERSAPLRSLLHLAGDLPLADDQAVEAGGDAEQVPHGLRVRRVRTGAGGPDRRATPWNSARNSASRPASGSGCAVRPGQVQLDAVAGAQDDRLAAVPGGQVGGGRVALRRRSNASRSRSSTAAVRKLQPTARRFIPSPPLRDSGCDATRVTNISTKATIVNRASRRAGDVDRVAQVQEQQGTPATARPSRAPSGRSSPASPCVRERHAQSPEQQPDRQQRERQR